MTRHQYGISVVNPQTSFHGKPVVVSGNISCFLTPQNLGEREKVILAVKIIVAGLKSTEIHSDKNVILCNQLSLLHKEKTSYCIFINMFYVVFEKRNVKNTEKY